MGVLFRLMQNVKCVEGAGPGWCPCIILSGFGMELFRCPPKWLLTLFPSRLCTKMEHTYEKII